MGVLDLRPKVDAIRSKEANVSRFLPAALVAALMLLAVTPAVADGRIRTYEVTVTNQTDAQPFTPALVATHKGSDGLFRVGATASFGLKEIAENGNLDPMLARIGGDSDFADVDLGFGADLPPVLPGETVTVTVTASPPFNFLSWASMLICTNDGFTGVDGVKLPNRIGDTVAVAAGAYDAGTEVNTEAWADIVPPCAPLTGFDNGGESATMSNPALAEDGRIHKHPGIAGQADLDADVHGWTGAPATITITRTG